jgi:hypothetical protein
MGAHCNYTVACMCNFFLSVCNGLHKDSNVCALLLRIRKIQCKKRQWVHPILSKILLNGQFYKLYEDLIKCPGECPNYFRMIIEIFHKLLVLVGPRITHENTQL